MPTSNLMAETADYMTLLVAFGVFIWSFLGSRLSLMLLRSVVYWKGLLLFLIFCTSLETIALTATWWTFSSGRIAGIHLLAIPVEEYILFVGFYTLVVGSWEVFTHA